MRGSMYHASTHKHARTHARTHARMHARVLTRPQTSSSPSLSLSLVCPTQRGLQPHRSVQPPHHHHVTPVQPSVEPPCMTSLTLRAEDPGGVVLPERLVQRRTGRVAQRLAEHQLRHEPAMPIREWKWWWLRWAGRGVAVGNWMGVTRMPHDESGTKTTVSEPAPACPPPKAVPSVGRTVMAV